jgi:hypothetical protein
MPNIFKPSPPALWKPPLGAQINPAHPLSKGLISGHIMNEGGGDKAYDISGNNNHFTFNGGANWTAGKFGPAIKFNGSTGYLSASDAGFPSSTAARTFSIWFSKQAAVNKSFGCYGRPGNATGASVYQQFISYVNTSGTTGFSNYGLGFDGTKVLSLNTWNHYVVVCRAGGVSQSIYINGVLDTNGAISVLTVLNGHYVLGCRWDGDSSRTDFLQATLDIPLMYNRALSPTEIKQLYLEPFCFMQPSRGIILPLVGSSTQIYDPYYYQQFIARIS